MDKQKTDVCELAKLAKITLTQVESKAFSHDFDELLSFLESITKTELSADIVSNTVDSLREDVPCVEFSREELLANAATTADGYITVPLVMEDL